MVWENIYEVKSCIVINKSIQYAEVIKNIGINCIEGLT